MNIFYLDRDPKMAARFHNDKHVVKMILESAQLLSTAHRVLDAGDLSNERNQLLYKATHKNHPSALWVRCESSHYRWLYDLLVALIGEYHYRYKDRTHACERLLPALQEMPQNISVATFVDPPQCMPDDCKGNDAVQAYRTYYAKYKAHFSKWTRRKQPEWWVN